MCFGLVSCLEYRSPFGMNISVHTRITFTAKVETVPGFFFLLLSFCRFVLFFRVRYSFFVLEVSLLSCWLAREACRSAAGNVRGGGRMNSVRLGRTVRGPSKLYPRDIQYCATLTIQTRTRYVCTTGVYGLVRHRPGFAIFMLFFFRSDRSGEGLLFSSSF